MAASELIDPNLELGDGRLRLRPWQTEHLQQQVAAVQASMESLGRWLPWCHPGYDETDARSWINACQAHWRQGEQYAFAIHDALDDSLLGGVGLNQRNRQHRSANLGYWVRQSHQGRGIAAHACRLIARFGFERLGLIRIEVVALVDNLASRRAAEKAGARFEGIARQRLWTNEQAWDAAVYALVPSDLDQPAEAHNAAMS
jgi:RimJ/RimL family protein N-acetyltransferase